MSLYRSDTDDTDDTIQSESSVLLSVFIDRRTAKKRLALTLKKRKEYGLW